MAKDNEQPIQLQILGISSGQAPTSYTLILEEVEGHRKLPIIIGAFEAQAIAIEIEKIVPSRPMTHDLIKKITDVFEVKIKEVIIYRLNEGIFYSHLVCSNGVTEEIIDARTSDAIALAVRYRCPIFTYERIMNEAGILLGDDDNPEPAATELSDLEDDDLSTAPPSEKSFHTMTKDELEQMLEEALEVENYILAAKIRDEIAKRA